MAIPISGSMDVVRGLKAAGIQARYGTIWLGPWTSIVNGKVSALASHITTCRAEGVTPFVQFFEAGDQITEAFFDGTVTTSRGANLARWWTLVKAIGQTFGTQEGIVNLELEWFKGTIADGAPKFDSAWADAAHTIRGLAPNVRISNCPGEWCPSSKLKSLFPKMVATTDIWATQNLRGLTRDSITRYANGPNDLLTRLRDYRAAFPGKPLMVTDLAYSTYGGAFSKTHPFLGGNLSGADQMQKDAFSRLVALRPQFEAIGVTDIIIRSLRDVNMDDAGNYYGAGEDGWGLVRQDGTKKPAYSDLMVLARPTTAPEPPAPVDPCLDVKTALKATQASLEASQAALTVAVADGDAAQARLDALRATLRSFRTTLDEA